jgi:anti-anti-sigma regulatory factor
VTDCSIARERDGERVTLRVTGVFDRACAWALREEIERESAKELLLDFGKVRDFSDLGVAVVAHGLSRHGRRVLFRGLRQHQLRILRYCGVTVDETSAREAEVGPALGQGTPVVSHGSP